MQRVVGGRRAPEAREVVEQRRVLAVAYPSAMTRPRSRLAVPGRPAESQRRWIPRAGAALDDWRGRHGRCTRSTSRPPRAPPRSTITAATARGRRASASSDSAFTTLSRDARAISDHGLAGRMFAPVAAALLTGRVVQFRAGVVVESNRPPRRPTCWSCRAVVSRGLARVCRCRAPRGASIAAVGPTPQPGCRPPACPRHDGADREVLGLGRAPRLRPSRGRRDDRESRLSGADPQAR